MGTAIEIREFKNPEHLDIMISTFQFDLAPNETLYVESFSRGAGQAPPTLSIAIDGIESVDDFISRYKGYITEIDVVEYPYFLEYREQFGAFRICTVSIQGSSARELVFYQNEDGITAKLDVGDRLLRRLEDVYGILLGYIPCAWLHPIFLVPVAIQAGLAIFVVVRFIRRIIHKTHNKKHLNEGV